MRKAIRHSDRRWYYHFWKLINRDVIGGDNFKEWFEEEKKKLEHDYGKKIFWADASRYTKKHLEEYAKEHNVLYVDAVRGLVREYIQKVWDEVEKENNRK